MPGWKKTTNSNTIETIGATLPESSLCSLTWYSGVIFEYATLLLTEICPSKIPLAVDQFWISIFTLI